MPDNRHFDILDHLWVLDENNQPKRPANIEEWIDVFMQRRHLASDKVGPYWISTIFLGTGIPQLGSNNIPPLWETAVFVNASVVEAMKYSSQAEAEAGHKQVVRQFEALTGKQAIPLRKIIPKRG